MNAGNSGDFSISFLPIAAGVIGGCIFNNGTTNICLVLLLLTGCFLLNRKNGVLMAAGILAGFTASILDDFIFDSSCRELPASPARITLVCRSSDTRAASIPQMPKPKSLTAKVLSIDGKTSSFNPEILIRPGKEYFPRCGETFTVTGCFTPAARQSTFGSYLISRNIAGTCSAQTLKSVLPPSGFLYRLCQIRDLLLERTVGNIRSQDARIIAGTMFFGTSGGFDQNMRQIFIDSGTLHLFSVSGMHLAVLFALFLLPARLLPFKLRYFFLAAVTTLYALSTGANPPVLRALLVILLWCAAKAFCFRKSNLELLSLAAVLLFLFSPHLVFNMGTQYSFFITFMLILTAQRINEYKRSADALYRHVPFSKELRRREKKNKILWQLLFTFCACCTAFIAGIGISAANNTLVLPGSILMNLLLCFFLVPLFFLTGLKLLLGDLLPGIIPETALLLLEKICFEGSSFAFPLELILKSRYEALVFCILLALSAGLPVKKYRIPAAAAAAGLMCLWFLRPHFQKPEAAIISQDVSHPPVIAIAETQENLGFIINFSNYEMTEKAVRFLLDRGIRRAEAFLFTGEQKSASAVHYAAVQLSPRRLRLPDRPVKAISGKIAEKGLRNVASGGRETEFVKIFKEKSSFRLEYFNPGSKLSFRIIWYDTPQGRQFLINDVPLRCISWSNSQEVVCYGFEK